METWLFLDVFMAIAINVTSAKIPLSWLWNQVYPPLNSGQNSTIPTVYQRSQNKVTISLTLDILVCYCFCFSSRGRYCFVTVVVVGGSNHFMLAVSLQSSISTQIAGNGAPVIIDGCSSTSSVPDLGGMVMDAQGTVTFGPCVTLRC